MGQWRPISWAIFVWTVLAMIGATLSYGVGLVVIGPVWMGGFLFLGLIWWATKPAPPTGIAPGVMLTPAGWYPDPQDPARRRWWDGARWTEHVQP